MYLCRKHDTGRSNVYLNSLLFNCSVVSDSAISRTAARQASILHHLPELIQIHVRWVGDAIQPSPLLFPFPPAFNVSQHQGLFQGIDSLHQVAKYWSFSIRPSNECSGLISFQFGSVQSLSRVRLFATPWIADREFPSPIPGVYSNSCPSSRWCHLT